MNKVTFSIGGVSIEMDKEEASKALEAGKFELKSDGLTIYTTEEFEKFKENYGKTEYNNGKHKGVEMAVKEARDKFGLSFEGKTVDNLADALMEKAKSDAKVEPNAKIEALTKDLETIKKNYADEQTAFATFKSEIENKQKAQKKDSALLKMMPTNLLVDPEIALLALRTKKGIDVEINEAGKFFHTINGEMQKNKSLEPIELNSDFMIEQLKEIGLLAKSEGGKGAGDEPGKGGGANDYDRFVKRMEEAGISEGSIEFNEKMNDEVKTGTLKL